MELKDQLAVVTGGSRGIGRGICPALAEAGADIVVNYRKDEKSAGEVVMKVKARLESTPLGRIAYPEDIGDLAVFLVSDEASYVTGKVIHMDGGIL